MNKKNRRALYLVVFCVLILGWNSALSSRRKNNLGTLVKVKKENVELKISCPGRIEALVQQTLRSEVDGSLKGLFVHEGDAVKAGQLLLQISDDKIKIELNQKRNSYQNSYSDFMKARKDFDLAKRLLAQQAVPKQDVENARQSFERAAQSLLLAQEEKDLTEKKAKSVNVISPINGVVIKIYTDSDSMISAGKDLIKVAQLDKFVVRGKVDELDIATMKVGLDAIVLCDSFPGIEMKARVTQIGAQAGEGTFAEIDVVLEITDSKNLQLKPNLTCEANIITGRLNDALVIPAGAIHRDEKEMYVFQTQGLGWLRRRAVHVVQRNAGSAIIADGLEAGQQILVPQEE